MLLEAQFDAFLLIICTRSIHDGGWTYSVTLAKCVQKAMSCFLDVAGSIPSVALKPWDAADVHVLQVHSF